MKRFGQSTTVKKLATRGLPTELETGLNLLQSCEGFRCNGRFFAEIATLDWVALCTFSPAVCPHRSFAT